MGEVYIVLYCTRNMAALATVGPLNYTIHVTASRLSGFFSTMIGSVAMKCIFLSHSQYDHEKKLEAPWYKLGTSQSLIPLSV